MWLKERSGMWLFFSEYGCIDHIHVHLKIGVSKNSSYISSMQGRFHICEGFSQGLKYHNGCWYYLTTYGIQSTVSGASYGTTISGNIVLTISQISAISDWYWTAFLQHIRYLKVGMCDVYWYRRIFKTWVQM